MKKKILSILLLITVFFSSIMSVSAAAPATVVFSNRNLNGVTKQTNAGTTYKQVTSGSSIIIGYCMNKSLNAPKVGTVMSNPKDITNSGIAYIFANGYGGTWNTALLGNGLTNDQRYYATQLAVWIYQGTYSESSLNNDAVAQAAKKLVAEARKAPNGDPKISLATSGNKMSQSGDYYYSDWMTVSGHGYDNYQVTLINAGAKAQVELKAGTVYQSGVRLTNGVEFRVRIPKTAVNGNMNIKVQVAAVAKKTNIYQYTTSGNYQDISIPIHTTVNVSDTKSFSLDYKTPTGTLKIEKVDAETGALLPGAKIQVTSANGTVVSTFTTNGKVHVIDNLPIGKYTVTEIEAPNGYQRLKTSVNVTVEQAKTVTIKLENKKIKKSSIEIIKVDGETNKPVIGAKLQLKDASGKVIDTWYSETYAHKIADVNAGTYYVSEVAAPSGYILSNEVIKVEVQDGGKIYQVKMINYPEKYGVLVAKVDSKTGAYVSGAKLVLKDASGKVIDSWTSTNEAHVIKNLAKGTYYLSETQAPNGYELSNEVVKFDVDGNGTTTKVIEFKNTPKEVFGAIRISKQDISTKKELCGAKLEIVDESGKVIASWVSSNEPHYITGLKPGKYTLREDAAPKGYIKTYETIDFEIDQNGKPSQDLIIMYNSKEVNTGGEDMIIFYAGLLAFLSLGGFGFYKVVKG